MDRFRIVALLVLLAALPLACAKRPSIGGVPAPGPREPTAAPPPLVASPVPELPPGPGVVTRAPAVARAAPRPEEFVPVVALADVFFDFDRAEIRPDAARTLQRNLEWLHANPRALVLVEGHCDERGTNEYNLILGERRARAVFDYLVAHGVAADRLSTVSYGEERPVCVERNERCWARNRRAHFLVKRP
jgi:peptidoglycan-associated lipoprotein